VWLPTYASWLDQIEIWFSILQRKLLQPGNFASLDELAQSIMEFVRCDNLELTQKKGLSKVGD